MEISCGFCVFKYAPWQKMKTWKHQKSTKSFLNKNTPIVQQLPLPEKCSMAKKQNQVMPETNRTPSQKNTHN